MSLLDFDFLNVNKKTYKILQNALNHRRSALFLHFFNIQLTLRKLKSRPSLN